MPRPWVLEHIRETAHQSLNLTDYWEYGRLLELLNMLDADDILKEFVNAGLVSTDVDVREMAENWAEKMASGTPYAS